MNSHTHSISLPLLLPPSLPPFSLLQELVSALHGLTLLYEKQFHIAALNFSEGKRIAASNLTTSVTPTGWIHVTIDPPELETSLEGGTPTTPNFHSPRPTPLSGSPSLSNSLPGKTQNSVSNGLDTHNGEPLQNSTSGPPGEASLPLNFSRGSINNGGEGGGGEGHKQFLDSLPGTPGGGAVSFGVRNWYQQIWRGVVYLASDPFPEVADIAQHVVHSLHDKVSILISIS